MDPKLETDLALLCRIQDLEACLVYVRNFLPEPLKKHCEEVLWPPNRSDPSSS